MQSQQPNKNVQHFDVVIAGGGLSGLTLAKQLRIEQPELSVAVVEKVPRPLPEACHKVGESSVELGSHYFERLGLREYLLEKHIVKFGLRFFPGGGHLPIQERAEIGPSQEPPVPSYQIDRGRFESDVRDMLEADGVTLIEGALVRNVEFGPGKEPHLVTIADKDSGDERQLSAHWMVDATGRNGLLRRKLKSKRGTGHAANASWWRVEGRINITDFVEDDANDPAVAAYKQQPFADIRWRSTCHFMGEGYWVWFIPLSSGNTSIGIVVHDDVHSFDEVRTYERSIQWLEKHEPYLAEAIKDTKVLDFLCLSNYSHNAARCWSEERWAMVGEAGAFVDPLYSPGSDFIAFANSFTSELIRVERAGEDLVTRTRELNLQYRALVMGAVGVFKTSAPTYGHARAMASKIYWDNFAYWSFPCQYFMQRLYQTTGEIHTALTMVGARFVEISGFMQSLFRAWAQLCPEKPSPGFLGLPHFPSLLVEAHLDLRKQMTPEESLEYFKMRRGQGEEIAAELVMRVLAEVGPEVGAQLLDRAGASSWDLRFSKARVEAEATTGMGRRHALSPIARDVERNLGRIDKHPQWRQALELLPLTDVSKSSSTEPRVAPSADAE